MTSLIVDRLVFDYIVWYSPSKIPDVQTLQQVAHKPRAAPYPNTYCLDDIPIFDSSNSRKKIAGWEAGAARD